MADLTIRLELGRGLARVGLLALLLAGAATELGSESLVVTTYYPAPSGVYTELLVTGPAILARDNGNVGIGTPTPGFKLDVVRTDQGAYTPTAYNPAQNLHIGFKNADQAYGFIHFASHGSMENSFGVVEQGGNGQGDFVFQAYNPADGYKERMRITSKGAVTKPSQPWFIAGHNVGTWESVGAAGWLELQYNTVGAGNSGGWYNAGNGRFTAPVAGLYLFMATSYLYAGCYSAQGYIHYDIGVNGAPVSGGGRANASYQILGVGPSEGTYNSSGHATRLLYLNAGDYASVWNYISYSSGACYRYGSYSYFSGALIN